MTFKILSFDGGGIRGLISALLLKDLNDKYGVIDSADGVAGTSTGAMISLGLANDVSIETIIGKYEKEGETIFRANPDYTIFSLNPQCKYLNTGLKETVSAIVGDKLMNQSTKALAVVNTARLWNGKSWEPVHMSNISQNEYNGVKMVDAAMASAAAPTYFQPYEIPPYDYFADGGLYANNPSVTAIAEALHGKLVDDIKEIRVLSFGTGESPEGIPPTAFGKDHEPIKWGAGYWFAFTYANDTPAEALAMLALDASAKAATIQANEILGPDRIQRANFELCEPYQIDDWQKHEKLENWTKAHMDTPEWQQVRDWVSKNWK